MKTLILPIKEPAAIQLALKITQDGGLVAFPTDTVYGVGSSAFNQAGVESIFVAKDRPPEKAIPILIADKNDLELVAMEVPRQAHQLAEYFWPGPLTLVLPKRETLPKAVSITPNVGVRIPDHMMARALFRMAGPMAVSSANRSGSASPCSAEEVFRQLHGRIPLILDGGRTPGGIPSTVVDVTGKELVLVREGPISLEKIIAIYS